MPTPRSNEEWNAFWQSEEEKVLANPRGWLRSAFRDFRSWNSRSLFRTFNLYVEVSMARGKSQSDPKTSTRQFQPTDFVEIAISAEAWGDVQKIYGNPDVLVDAVSDLLESGYRVGLSHNGATDAFIYSVTCRDSSDINNGKTFNAFAETWYEALQTAMYKHYVIAKKQWNSDAQRAAKPKFG
jgi:hypothetical protein